MKTTRPFPNSFLTTNPFLPLSPDTTPTTTLAHIYANLHANNNNSMAQAPLAHSRSLNTESGSLQAELHAQYSMIAMVVLAVLFFTITISATGLLLAFCKKKNTVFTLQKSEQDSHFEMDDLEKTDTESCHDDAVGPNDRKPSSSRPSDQQQKRSKTFPDLSGLNPRNERVSIETQYREGSSESLDSRTPLMSNRPRTHRSLRTDVSSRAEHGGGEVGRRSSVKRAVTVAAIHHADRHVDSAENCSVRIHVEDFDSRSEISDSAFDHLYLQLQEEDDDEEEGRKEEQDHGESDADDDVKYDQTRALLKC